MKNRFATILTNDSYLTKVLKFYSTLSGQRVELVLNTSDLIEAATSMDDRLLAIDLDFHHAQPEYAVRSILDLQRPVQLVLFSNQLPAPHPAYEHLLCLTRKQFMNKMQYWLSGARLEFTGSLLSEQ